MVVGSLVMACRIIANKGDQQSDMRNSCNSCFCTRFPKLIAFKMDGTAEELIRQIAITDRKRKAPISSKLCMDDNLVRAKFNTRV